MRQELKFPNLMCDINLCREHIDELEELLTFNPDVCKRLRLHWPPDRGDIDQQFRAALDELEQLRREKVEREEKEILKPLTMEDIEKLHSPCVLIEESRTYMSLRPVILHGVGDLTITVNRDGNRSIWKDEYGVDFRFWMPGTFRNPTEGERRAAPWR